MLKIVACFLLIVISLSIEDNYITALIKIKKKERNYNEVDIIHSYKNFMKIHLFIDMIIFPMMIKH